MTSHIEYLIYKILAVFQNCIALYGATCFMLKSEKKFS